MSAAEAARTTFSTSRLLDFCSQRELTAQTGTAPSDWPLMIIRELVDNGLDAAEESGVALVIRVTVARGRIRVRDNGRGIPPETVASILDFGTRTSSREAYVAPDRGRQGNALKTVLAMPFALSGTAGRVEIEARGGRHVITFRADPVAQAPVISHQQTPASVRTGTAITVWWPDSACSQLAAAGRHFLPMLARFTDLNPHVSICATWVDEDLRRQWTWKATDPDWSKWTPSAPTSPHWYRRADLERLVGAFLARDRQRNTTRLLRDFLAQFDGLAGTVKRSTVLAAVDLQRAPPWVAEAAFAYRPDEPTRQLISGLNWSPALDPDGDHFRLGAQLSAAYCWQQSPVVILAHLICPRPEFLDRGKVKLAPTSPGFAAIEEAVAQVTKDWAKQRRSEIRDRSREQNRQERLRLRQAVKLSLKDAVLRHLPAVIETTSNSGKLSFTQRDLFYGARPLVQAEQDKSLSYNYFTALLTEIEAEQGEIAGLQRETRGTLYHPHLREEIPLSTESVAAYRRPIWTFNKLVYIEKAGTQKNLIEVSWPEEHDCAIASAAGFTTRALKDLVDLLATSPEPITVFCVHDADAAGTMIHETLQRETKARGARKIEIVNLGLEPWEAVELGLEAEPVEPTEKRRPVAAYVDDHDLEWRDWLDARGFVSWAGWLQTWRVELNAMSPADRVEWLTVKIEAHPPRKVIPPARFLNNERIKAAREEIFDELLARAKLEERTEEILGEIEWPVTVERLPKDRAALPGTVPLGALERADGAVRRQGRAAHPEEDERPENDTAGHGGWPAVQLKEFRW